MAIHISSINTEVTMALTEKLMIGSFLIFGKKCLNIFGVAVNIRVIMFAENLKLVEVDIRRGLYFKGREYCTIFLV